MNSKIKKIDNYINTKNIFLTYSLFFITLFIIGLLPIEIKNKTFLFSGLFHTEIAYDGLNQHLMFMRDFISSIKNFVFHKKPLDIFRFNIGLGSDFFISYSYYSLFDPLLIIAYIIPIKYIEFSYYLILMLRIYLAGIFFIILAQEFQIRNHKALLASSIFYSLNHIILYSAFRHPMFINGAMLLPLIILGAERVINNKSPLLLIVSVFYAIMAQFYYFVFICFGFELFVILRLYSKKDKTVKKFFRVNIVYLLGVLLAAFMLLPVFIFIIQGGRVSSKGFVFYNLLDLYGLLNSLIIPITSYRYSASIGNDFILFIVLIYIFNNPKNDWLSKFVIILIGLYFIPIFGYMINGFSYLNNRWTFLIMLPVSLIIAQVIEDDGCINDIAVSKSLQVLFYLLLIILVLSPVVIGIYVDMSILLKISIIIGIIIFGFIIIKGLVKNQERIVSFFTQLNKDIIFKTVITSSLLVAIIISFAYTKMLLPGYSYNKFYDDEFLYETITKDDSFYRVEQNLFEGGLNSFSNDNLFYGFNSTSQYNSLTNPYLLEFIDEYKIINNNNSVGINGFNGISRLLNINNVKYYIIKDSEKINVPYGFSYYDRVDVKKYDANKKPSIRNGNFLFDSDGVIAKEEAKIYINDNYLPLGNLFDSYILRDDFNKLSPIERQLLLLDTIVLDYEIDGINKFNINNELIKGNEVIDLKCEGIKLTDKYIEVLGEIGKVSFEIKNIFNAEVFLEISGIENVNKQIGFKTKYYTNDHYVEVNNYGYGSNMYQENNYHLVNLGYYEYIDNLDITIELDKGKYHYFDINYYLVDSHDIKQKTNNLKDNSLFNLDTNTKGLRGNVDSDDYKLLYLSVPYSRGFKAYVDGVESNIYKANIGFLAIMVPPGYNTIELIYETPGLKLGIYISLTTLCLLLVILISKLIYKQIAKIKDI